MVETFEKSRTESMIDTRGAGTLIPRKKIPRLMVKAAISTNINRRRPRLNNDCLPQSTIKQPNSSETRQPRIELAFGIQLKIKKFLDHAITNDEVVGLG
jgi:hypothetical protein